MELGSKTKFSGGDKMKDKRINGILINKTIEIIKRVSEDSDIAEKRSGEIMVEIIDRIEGIKN